MGSLILPASGAVYADAQIFIYSVEKHPVHEPPMPFKRLRVILAVARSFSRMTFSYAASLVCRLSCSTMS